MSSVVDAILNVNALLVYVLVAALVFAEDAIFVGFIIPGETAAVLGGVVASRGHVDLWLLMILVALAAIVGDSVGYEVGKHFGPRLLNIKILARHRHRLQEAQDVLRRRGGAAVFLGRFTAFFRAVMPALAGTSRMPYRVFLAYNAAGGIVWGVGYVLLGFLAGNSYEAVAKATGGGVAVVIALIVIAALIVWRVRKGRRERRLEREPQQDRRPDARPDTRPDTRPEARGEPDAPAEPDSQGQPDGPADGTGIP